MPLPTPLQIARGKDGPSLTPAQKRFNALIRQIEQARQALAAWQDAVDAYRTAFAQRLLPLEQESFAVQRQWVLALDQLLARKGWNGTERRTLREALCAAAGELLQARGDDAQLKALFDQHAEVDFDTGQRQAALAMKEATEALTGVDLGEDDGIHTEQDVLERMRQGMEERAAAAQASQQERASRRRKSAAQQRREAQAQLSAQSLREIFRKLASALHPDRETDPARRATKTALMQRANQAHAANDLLALLELQLQAEQIDAHHMAGASTARLKHFNQVLEEQLAELQVEIERVEKRWRMDFGVDPMAVVQPSKLQAVLDKTERQWRAALAESQRDLAMLEDAAATKRWLKRQRQRVRGAF